MSTKKPIFIANWKMNMPLLRAQAFMNTHLQELGILAERYDSTIVICPSHVALPDLCAITRNSIVKIGAQNCSEHREGAYTGEIDALSLRQLGCIYGIVGHSERRYYFDEFGDITAQKVRRLAENNIIPIICVGETYNEYKQGNTIEILQHQQLDIILPALSSDDNITNKAIIAYEPSWAIGTDKIPEYAHLEHVFWWINQLATETAPNVDFTFIYGGSVDPHIASLLFHVPYVSGFLVGRASLDFQKFQNIVISSNSSVTTIA